MKNLYFLLVIVPFQLALSQTLDSLANQSRVFQLGEVVIYGTAVDTMSIISFEKIEKFNRTDISGALNILSGITLGNVGPRNEAVVYVRGFDLRQIPVFIDGVPVYVPYDGYVDMGRFTTFDLSQIHVAKGFSSILYGANTMGGAINLVTRRPKEKLEINGSVGLFSGEGSRWNINAGTNLGKYYLQFGASQLKQTFYPLSDNLTPSTFEDGSERENSYRQDTKISFKAGYTPNSTDEYVIGYSRQQGEKGTPPYIGSDPNIRTRFWQWPKWDKQSVYLVSNTLLSDKNIIKTRWFYDTFENELFSYDDANYSSITRPYAFQSFYDDYTVGGNAELESRLIPKNVLKLGAQFKRDIHRENNLNEPQRTFIDHTFSIGIENTYQLNTAFSFVPGISYNVRSSVRAEDYNSTNQEILSFPSNENSAINAQIGFFWDINSNHFLKSAISRKTRFATIKDRYSYRLGQAIPNPDLAAEVAINYDLTYTGRVSKNATLNLSFYRSDISNIVQQIDNVQPGRFQLQNAGNALFYGFEVNADYVLTKYLNFGANYSYIRRNNLSNPEILFTNVPNHKTFGYVEYKFHQAANFLFNTEYNSKRYSTSYGTKVGGYTLFNFKTSIKIQKNIHLEGGINNIGDKNYALVEGFPEIGRNYFVNIVFGNI